MSKFKKIEKWAHQCTMWFIKQVEGVRRECGVERRALHAFTLDMFKFNWGERVEKKINDTKLIDIILHPIDYYHMATTLRTCRSIVFKRVRELHNDALKEKKEMEENEL